MTNTHKKLSFHIHTHTYWPFMSKTDILKEESDFSGLIEAPF